LGALPLRACSVCKQSVYLKSRCCAAVTATNLFLIPFLDPPSRSEMMKHFTPEQQNRYEAYRRSAFGKNGIKKVRTHV
jgi:hypothetical protein